MSPGYSQDRVSGQPIVSRRDDALGRAIASDVDGAARTFPFDPIADPRAAEAELGVFAFRWLLATLQRMGVLRQPGESWTIQELRARLGVVPRYHRYFEALLRKLEAKGVVTIAGRGLEATSLVREFPLTDVPAQVLEFKTRFRERYPSCAGLLELTSAGLERYDEIVTGRVAMTDVLFHEGAPDLFGHLFQGSPVADYFNHLIGVAVRAAIVGLSEAAPGSRIRIVELGAGTGGTTAAVLDAIAPVADGVEFSFTDISYSFLRRANRRFAARYPWVDYRILDIERDLASQGFAPHSVDVIIAANVLHDTRDIEITLAQVGRLLTPGGLLVLCEFTTVKECLSFSGALLHGYWVFTDPERRQPDSCLLSVPQWRRVLERTRFSVANSFPLPTQEPDRDCTQIVMLCQSAAAPVEAGTPSGPVAAAVPTAHARRDPDAGGEVEMAVEQAIRSLLGAERASQYDPARPLMEMGLDSIELVDLSDLLQARFTIDLRPAFFFEHETPRKVAAAIAAACSGTGLTPPRREEDSHGAARSELPQTIHQSGVGNPPPSTEGVAVVGISCRLPGGVTSADEFWELLERGTCAVGTLPAGRWRWPAGIDPGGSHRGIDKGAFLDAIDEFDAAFFRVSAREATLMDPQQRLLLELGWEALEDAGHAPSDLAGRRVAVFVGVCHEDYRELLNETVDGPSPYIGTGTAPSMLANRLSYFFDFKGPSVAVDTACSSSLFALHYAVDAIRRGECEQALVGGANLLCSPTTSISYYQAGMLSPSGLCRTFDHQADGYVRGEGAAMLVLKPLGAARRDGDAIYGVIRATAVNHGGQAASLTAPNADAQAALVEAAWHAAGDAAACAGYLETHGTGTRLGDPVEIRGLVTAFERLYRARRIGWPTEPRCAIGSVKTNIGHLEAAAGLAGAIKVLLAIGRRRIPPTINFERLNPAIDLAQTPFFVAAAPHEWPAPRDADGRAQPRRGGVSSFGFGGANAHAVIEEYVAGPSDVPSSTGPELIPLSAPTPHQLTAQAERLRRFLQRSPAPRLGDLAHTLQIGRTAFEHRVAVVADSVGALTSALQSYVDGASTIPNLYRGGAPDPGATPSGLASVACRWTAGAEVQWRELSAGTPRRRAHLPTYAFARERYWPAAAAHPWLGTAGAKPLGYRFSTSFSGDEFFLRDHVIGGQRLLPAVVYLELARAAVQRLGYTAHSGRRHDEPPWSLHGVVWMRPWRAGVSPATLAVEVMDESSEEMTFRIVGSGDAPDQAVSYAEGRVRRHAPASAPVVDIGRTRSRCVQAYRSGAECYDAFRSIGFAYGPSQRAIAEVYVGSGELVARLELPDDLAGTCESMVLHPSLADGAVQAGVALCLATARTGAPPSPVVPFELDAIDIFSPCAPAMWAVVRGGDNTVDIDLCAADGRVCARVSGLRMRATGVQAAASARGHGAGEMTLAPAWERIAAAPSSAGDALGPARTAIVGGSADDCRAIGQAYPASRELVLEPEWTADRIAAAMQRWGEIEHLVWILPPVLAGCADSALLEAQRQGAFFGFRVIKALLQSGYGDRSLAVSVFTSGVHAIGEDEVPNPAHASVHGLAGSLAREYEQWHVRVFDVPASASVPWQTIGSLAGAPRGSVVVCREHGWYRQQLVPYPLPAGPSPPERTNEVYVIIGGAGGIGSAWSEALLRTARVQVVWIGRRPADRAIEEAIGRLAALGPAPLYISADARDAGALRAARDRVLERFGRIDGVVHAAMVLRDRSLANMTEQEFRDGFAAKADVCVRLAQVFGTPAPRFVLFFSSFHAFYTNAGQSNYVAGSTFEDAFARRLAVEWPCRVRVANWGYWAVGSAASDHRRSAMARRGFESIGLAGAVRVIDHLLEGPSPQLAYVNTTRPEALDGVNVRREDPGAVRDAAVRGTAGAVDAMLAAPREVAIGDLIEVVRAAAARELGVAPAALETGERPFAEMRLAEVGLDSLSSSSLRTVLRQHLGITTSAERILSDTVASLAGGLYESLLLHQVTNRTDGAADEGRETYVF